MSSCHRLGRQPMSASPRATESRESEVATTKKADDDPPVVGRKPSHTTGTQPWQSSERPASTAQLENHLDAT
eukprot:UN5117